MDIPDDILALIFGQCLPSGRNATMRPSDAPIVLCHVCSGWRRLALRLPELWASLHIFTRNDNSNASAELTVQERDSRVVEWLERSGALPLSLSFSPITRAQIIPSTSSGKFHLNTTDLTRLFRLLAPTYDRWDEVDIVWNGYTARARTAFP